MGTLYIAEGFIESWLHPQRWGGFGREETLKGDPSGWADAGLEQTARELGHADIHLTFLGGRGAQLRLSKAKAREGFCHGGSQ